MFTMCIKCCYIASAYNKQNNNTNWQRKS